MVGQLANLFSIMQAEEAYRQQRTKLVDPSKQPRDIFFKAELPEEDSAEATSILGEAGENVVVVGKYSAWHCLRRRVQGQLSHAEGEFR